MRGSGNHHKHLQWFDWIVGAEQTNIWLRMNRGEKADTKQACLSLTLCGKLFQVFQGDVLVSGAVC